MADSNGAAPDAVRRLDSSGATELGVDDTTVRQLGRIAYGLSGLAAGGRHRARLSEPAISPPGRR